MSDGSEIEHIWQTIYRFGFYRGGPVLMSALSGVSAVCFSGVLGMLISENRSIFHSGISRRGSWVCRFISCLVGR